MILQSFKTRLENLKRNNKHISYVLDIGAYRGDFTETLHSVWPNAIVRQIEADDRQRQYLNSNAIFALLGDTVGKKVDFYTLAEHKITTGSSIYKELTDHYNDTNTIVVSKEMTTIDELDKLHNFYGNWEKLGLIKMDTQGSELLILDGSVDFLSNKKPKYILIECSVLQYNNGAPRIFSVIEKLDKLNYAIVDVFDLSYDSNGQLLQTDILFERKN